MGAALVFRQNGPRVSASKKAAWLILGVAVVFFLVHSCTKKCGTGGQVPTSAPVTITAQPSAPGSQIGHTVASARQQVARTGLRVDVHDASGENYTPEDDWRVCFEKVTLSKVAFAAVPDGAPCPSKDGRPLPWPKMPDVRSLTYADAVQQLKGKVAGVRLEAAYADDEASDIDNDSGVYAQWWVCFQSTQPGDRPGGLGVVVLSGVDEDDSCPSSKGTYKNPLNDPDYTDPGLGSSSDEDDDSSSGGYEGDYDPSEKGGCPPGGCYNPCPPGGCRG